MKRILFNLLVLLSAIVCAASASTWAVSRVRDHSITYYDGNSMRHLVSLRGGVRAVRYQAGFVYADGWSYESGPAQREWVFGHPPTLTVLGFGWFLDTSTEYSPGYVIPQWTVVVPYWFIVLLSSALPGRWVMLAYRRRRELGRGFELSP